MTVPWWLPFGSVPEVAARSLASEVTSGAGPVLLDVRTPAEFARGHVRGARNVPVTALRSALPGLEIPPGTRVVAICLSAHRSPPAVRLLRAAGHDARQLAGGMLAWHAAGLPVERA
ncbi:MAG TPA: rhodanese-like domain-containing protein [Anaeromyxobacteraceae bacterium]|nr:rhodanese-like domain-containing protein [Anaeromyxobacteraceae bacterium]